MSANTGWISWWIFSGAQAFLVLSAGLQAKPTTPKKGRDGIKIRIRYIIQAHESHETRRRLNQAVVDLLQGKGSPAPAPELG